MKSAQEQIVVARRRAQLTQAELAMRVGTSQPAINRYERGRAVPSEGTLDRILQTCAHASRRPGEVLVEHRDQVLDLLHGSGATKVFVFGSVARGDDDERSDIDLLVDRLGPRAYSWGVPKVKGVLEDLLGFDVDIGELRHLKPAILERVLGDARPL